MEIIKIILCSILSVIALFIITKIMGHKQVAQLDFFDYVSGITIGSIGAELATELEKPLFPLIALLVYGIFSFVLNLCTQKLPKTRKFINGTPTILLSDGKIFRENLRKSKLDLSEFCLLCREQGYFNLDDISMAIFEHNGKLSILPRELARPLKPSDVGLDIKQSEIGVEIIMDGRVLGENLVRLGLNEKWLKKQIKAQGFKQESDILLGIYRKGADEISLYPMD